MPVPSDGGSCDTTEVTVSPMTAPTPAPRRVVIIGGVAGGMSAATRLRRLDADATITVLERSGHVSFANCGLPYFVGGLIEEEEDLTLQTPRQLFDRFRLDVRVNDEVVAIDRDAHTVTVRSTLDGGGARRALRQADPEHGSRPDTATDPRLRPGPHTPDRGGRRLHGCGCRRGAGDGCGDRSRIHRSRNGRESDRDRVSGSPSSRPPPGPDAARP